MMNNQQTLKVWKNDTRKPNRHCTITRLLSACSTIRSSFVPIIALLLIHLVASNKWLVNGNEIQHLVGPKQCINGRFYRLSTIPTLQKKTQHHRDNTLDLVINGIQRGGGSPLEPNPNYVQYNEYLPPTLGDEDSNHIRRPIQYQGNNYNSFQQNTIFPNHQQQTNNNKLKPLQQVVTDSMAKLHMSSPTVYNTIIASITIFITWQIPLFTNLLRNHFVCSQKNIIYHHRYHTLLTSAISHNSLSHLVMNLYGFYIFGRNVESTLKRNHLPLSLYCILSAIFSNAFFLQSSPKGSSCIGLSGVSLSLLALDAKLHPSKEIGFIVRFIPIRLPAQYALTGLLLWSLIGMVQMSSSSSSSNHDGVAHGVHFGGLVYGILIYEFLLKRGVSLKMMRNVRKIWYDWKRTMLK